MENARCAKARCTSSCAGSLRVFEAMPRKKPRAGGCAQSCIPARKGVGRSMPEIDSSVEE